MRVWELNVYANICVRNKIPQVLQRLLLVILFTSFTSFPRPFFGRARRTTGLQDLQGFPWFSSLRLLLLNEVFNACETSVTDLILDVFRFVWEVHALIVGDKVMFARSALRHILSHRDTSCSSLVLFWGSRRGSLLHLSCFLLTLLLETILGEVKKVEVGMGVNMHYIRLSLSFLMTTSVLAICTSLPQLHLPYKLFSCRFCYLPFVLD